LFMSEKIYGRKPVLEALRSGKRAITKVYLLQGSRDGMLNQVEAHAKAKGISIGLETRHRMDTMAGHDKHQGVIAVADDYQYADLQDLLDTARDKNEPAFILLLDEIEDPQNLGAILRSADAAGVHGVVIPKNRAAEVNATVIKASAGAAEHIQTVKVTNINDTIKKLKEANVWVVGTDIDATKNFYEYDYRQPVALVIGNEGKGLRRLVKENCDELVKIPMAGKMSSLNASVASALLLFEVIRQREWGISSSAKISPPTSAPDDSASPGLSSIPSYGMGYSPPEKDFFRPGPDPRFKTPGEGTPSEIIHPEDSNETDNPLGNPKGGGFHW
jgi:23S rRNA (guanosine2251-2'-O)-methyltransferase